MPKDTQITRDFRLDPVDRERLANLIGPEDENLLQISQRLGVEIAYQGVHFHLEGPSNKVLNQAERIIKQLYLETAPIGKHKHAEYITPDKVNLAIIENAHVEADDGAQPLDFISTEQALENTENARAKMKRQGEDFDRGSVGELYHKASTLKTQRGVIKARTPNQASYISQIVTHDVNFGIGPAGTGKTFLAVAAAVDALTRNEVRRIILTRPAVEAGEKLGFLPGDLTQKVDPYLRPLYDALFEMLGFEKVEKLIERQVIEIAPLAYMRGRTLNDSFIILDEAQNTTTEQMKMFLTRIGFNSKAVITGDPSQIDLPRNVRSGLRHAIEVLKDVSSISFTYFLSEDVVRHPVVAAIVNAYDAYDRAHPEGDRDFRRTSYRGPHASQDNKGSDGAAETTATVAATSPEAVAASQETKANASEAANEDNAANAASETSAFTEA